MAYAAINSLLNTIRQLWRYTGYYFQPQYGRIAFLRAKLGMSKTTGDVGELIRLDAEITEIACRTEDKLDAKSRKYDYSKLQLILEKAIRDIDSAMNKWESRKNFPAKKPISRSIVSCERAVAHIDSISQDLEEALASTSQHAVERENMMVGLDNEFQMMQNQLARGESELEVVSIVGMGGIGKTTLANKIYTDPFIISRFDIRTKATISQEYCARNVLLGLLSSISGNTCESHERQEDGKLADKLQKLLKGGRFLVIIDDIWTTEAWDDVKLCFPDCNNGSRILMTTRNVEVAEYASSGNPPFQMRLMNFDESWNLLHSKVFEKECFPAEFEKLGKQIALKCGGLPLAITVIAGLLSKIGKSLNEWESVAENVSLVVSTNLDVQCMRVLALSYHHLPPHLKPCFLYFAIFPEDELIFVNKLVKLWVAEGFLKQERMKSSEEVAGQCLKDLIDRSLIFIRRWSFDGKIKACGMHDVIRELCLREARNINFVNVLMEDQNSCEQTRHFSTKRRISVQSDHSSFVANHLAMVHYNKARSILFFIRNPSNSRIMQALVHFKVLRILELASPTLDAFPSCVVNLSLLRYLALTFYSSINDHDINVPPSISRLRSLETFILKFPKYYGRPKISFTLPGEIFKISQLRNLSLDRNNMAHRKYEGTLRYLQCLSGWNPLYCDYYFTEKVPHVRKLQICGNQQDYIKSIEKKVLYNLWCFSRLEELKFDGMPHSILPLINFPMNLKKLAFTNTRVNLEDLRNLGKLPKVEALKLKFASSHYIGTEWEVAGRGFPQLKFLLLNRLNIRYWRASSDHFPRLERLFLEECVNMESIPEDFAEITTLQLIDIRMCKESVVNSAKKIQQDVEDNYGGSIEVHFRYIL